MLNGDVDMTWMRPVGWGIEEELRRDAMMGITRRKKSRALVDEGLPTVPC